MFQRTKRLPPAKRTVTGVKSCLKKTGSQSAAKVMKTNPSAKKPGLKAPRTKAGFELYSEKSEDCRQGNAPDDDSDYIKTLMQEYGFIDDANGQLALNTSRSDPDQTHPSGDVDCPTLFNRRLVSSTPDPERFTEIDSAGPQSGPKQKRVQIRETAEIFFKDESACASTLLSESERECLRQQLDAAIMKEANTHSRPLHMKNMLKAQKQETGVPSSLSASGQPPLRKRTVPTKDALQILSGGQEVNSDNTELLSQLGPECTVVHADTSTVSSNSMSSTEVFSVTQHPVITTFTSFQALKPSFITANTTTSCHTATTTCSTVHVSERRNVQAPEGQKPKDSCISSTIPGLVHTTSSTSESGKPRQIIKSGNSQSSAFRTMQSDHKLQKTESGNSQTSAFRTVQSDHKLPENLPSEHYIHDGLHAYQAGALEKENVSPSFSALEVQGTLQASEEMPTTSSAAHLNRNNSNSYNAGQLNTNQNLYRDSPHPEDRQQSLAHLTQSVKEAVTGEGKTALPYENIEQFLQKITREKQKFTLTSEGPRLLHAIIFMLEDYANKQGDSHMCQLIEELISIVAKLPQLLPSFSFMDVMDDSQKKSRRIKMLNSMVTHLQNELKCAQPTDNWVDRCDSVATLDLREKRLIAEKQRLHEENQRLHKDGLMMMAKLVQLEEKNKKVQEINSRVERDSQLKLQQKEHEALVSHQEYNETTNCLREEVRMLIMRKQSVDDRLLAADRELAVKEDHMKEMNRQIYNLQTELGVVKQAVRDMIDSIGNAAGTDSEINSIFTVTSTKILLDFINNGKKESSTSVAHNLLHLSGNKRVGSHPTSDKSAVCQHIERAPISQEVCPPRGTISTSLARNGLYPKTSGIEEPLLTEERQKSSLTVAALAAHNEQLGITQMKGCSHSVHNWNGANHQKIDLANSSVCHSDPESMGVHAQNSASVSEKYDHIQQWSTDVESERQQAAEACDSSLHRVVQNMASSSNLPDNKPDNVSEIRSIPTLSEFPISLEKTGISEKGSLHSLSEYPISERNSWEPVKEVKSSAGPEEAHFRVTDPDLEPHHNVTDPDSKTATKSSVSFQHSSSAPAPPPKMQPEEANFNKDQNRHPVYSPSSCLTCSTSSTTQKNYFHGTELDISLSTIPEDTQSLVTNLTGISVSTFKSLDCAKFSKDLDNLDRNIDRAKQRLNELKKMH